MVVGLFWVMVGGGGLILISNEWCWVYFGLWWVVLVLFWLMVCGGGLWWVHFGWWWVVVGLHWMVVDGGEWWWVVVGGDTVYNNSLIFEKEGSKQNLFDSHKIIFLHLPIMIV